jgi:hypothetical protein
MEDSWPSGTGLRGQVPNRPVLRWLKTVVVSDREKAQLDCVRWGPGRRSRAPDGRTWQAALLEASKISDGIKTRGPKYSWDKPGRCPCTGQAVPGVEAA